MTTLHPVDSTIRTCCGGIGRHTRECVSTEHVPALPFGAAVGGDWDEGWRTVYGQRHEVAEYVAGAWASQLEDGSMERNAVHDVYVDEMVRGAQCERLNLSIAEARLLAHALLAAADTADGWVA